MNDKYKAFAVALLMGTFGALALASNAARTGMEDKVPARLQAKDATPEQRHKTAHKEAGAAFKEALDTCARANGQDKAACEKEARMVYLQGLSDAKKLLYGPRQT